MEKESPRYVVEDWTHGAFVIDKQHALYPDGAEPKFWLPWVIASYGY